MFPVLPVPSCTLCVSLCQQYISVSGKLWRLEPFTPTYSVGFIYIQVMCTSFRYVYVCIKHTDIEQANLLYLNVFYWKSTTRSVTNGTRTQCPQMILPSIVRSYVPHPVTQLIATHENRSAITIACNISIMRSIMYLPSVLRSMQRSKRRRRSCIRDLRCLVRERYVRYTLHVVRVVVCKRRLLVCCLRT